MTTQSSNYHEGAKAKYPGTFAVFLTIFIIFSCKTETHESENLITLNIDSLIDNKPIRYSDVFKSFTIIPLETNDESMFGYINDVEFCDSFIYIADQIRTQYVYRFDINGAFINKIGKIGRGPGEYSQSITISIDAQKGNVSVYDWTDNEIVQYDKNGTFQKSYSFKDKFFQYKIDDESIITYTPFPWVEENTHEKMINIFDHNGLKISSGLEFQNYIQGPRIMETTLSGHFFKSEDDVKFFSNYIDTIYSIKQGTCRPFMILSSNKYDLTQKDADAFNNKDFKERVDAKNATNKLMDISRYSENDSIAYFNFRIGGLTYHTFYDFKSERAECTSRLEDDLTFTSPSLCKISGNKFIAYVHTFDNESFIKSIQSKNINLTKSAKQRLSSMTNLSNPFIIVYELKNRLP